MAKFKKKVNTITRENESEIKRDSLASNRLAVKSKNYENAKVNKKKGKNSTKKEHVDILAPRKKKQRVYTEKELGIPKLNKSIDPEGVRKPRGKKGKIFADNDAMMRILYTVTEQIDNTNASKLEKARQLEQIREVKRKEMEQKEAEKKDKLNAKKKEIKSKSKKGGKSANNEDTTREKADKHDKKKKRVAFA